MATGTLSAFTDEYNPDPRFASPVMSALGIRHCALRFVKITGLHDVPVNIAALPEAQLKFVLSMFKDAGMGITSIGSPIGKKTLYGKGAVDMRAHVSEVARPCFQAAAAAGARYVRAFTGYLGEGARFEDHLAQAREFVAMLCELAAEFKVAVGFECERALIGETCAKIVQIIDGVSPWAGVIPDGGNLAAIGYTCTQIGQDVTAARNHLIAVHLKDISPSDAAVKRGKVTEEKDIKRFVPVGSGIGGYCLMLGIVRDAMEASSERLASLLGKDRALVDFVLEPHMNLSEQFFGSTSGPNFRLAADGAEAACTHAGIALDRYSMRDLEASWA